MAGIEGWYILATAQLGARATLRLLEVFQQPEAVLAAAPDAWSRHGRLSPGAIERLRAARSGDTAGALAGLARQGMHFIHLAHPAYPPRLRAIADPPVALFVAGDPAALVQPAIAIVGSRRASPYGRHVAGELAAGLAGHGCCVVSGLALGADGAAHEGCLRAGGTTVAVLAGGVDLIYPPEHADLYRRIVAAGAVISEQPPGSPHGKYAFPIRNRIISGLTLGVVVVEAPERSGALITAAHALDQGREVFAVPGSVNSGQSRGTHQLLRDGAKLVESVEDILEEFAEFTAPRRAPRLEGPHWDALDAPPAAEPLPEAPVAPPPPPLSPEEAAVFDVLGAEAQHVDTLIEATGLPSARVNAALLMLELKGLVRRCPGNTYCKG